MKKTVFLLGILILLSSGCSPAPTPPQIRLSVPYKKAIIGYYPAWAVGRGVFLKDIPYARLTHINYAFSDVSQNGECVLGDPKTDIERAFTGRESISGMDDSEKLPFRGNFNQVLQLKERYPALKVLIAIGGWTLSGNFSNAAGDEASRKRFATSCINLYLKQYKGVFDGLDIDWEYPVNGGMTAGKPEDKNNYTLLLAEIRRQLDELGKTENRRYLLTIAAPVGPGIIRNFELSQIALIVDWMNLMAYDFHGTWEKTTNFNAPLFRAPTDPADSGLNIDTAVQSYIYNGVPPNKIALGIPFYGRGWSGVQPANNGLYQPAAGAAPGKWEAGAFTYQEIVQEVLPNSQRFWNGEAHVPWLYNPDSKVFISYDDAQSIEAKAGYARDQGLAGLMIWDVSQGDLSLVDAIHKGLSAGGPPLPTVENLSNKPRPFEAKIHAAANITVDGKLNDWPAEPDFTLKDQTQVAYTLEPKSWGGPQDFSARVWIGWTSGGIYAAFEVIDDIHVQPSADSGLWRGDHVELQFDTRLENDFASSTMNEDDYQIGLSAGDFSGVPQTIYAWSNGPAAPGPLDQVKMAVSKTANGYILEVLIPKEALQGISLTEGATFGMNVSPSDADDAAQGQKVMLSTSRIRTYADPRTFGKITLVN